MANQNKPTINKEVNMANQTPGIIRLKPQQFIHVLDNNTGVTRLEVGPKK